MNPSESGSAASNEGLTDEQAQDVHDALSDALDVPREPLAASLREELDKPKRLTDFERIRAALTKGEDNDRLLDGREFDHRYWINAKAALGRIERKLEVAERELDALRTSYDAVVEAHADV